MSRHLSARFGTFSPFAGLSDREDGRAGGLQVGFTTYDTEEETGRQTYQTSYLEWAGRSDHLSDAIDSLRGITPTPQFVDECGDDAIYVRQSDEKAPAKKQAATEEASAS